MSLCAYDEEAGGGAGLEPVVRPLLPGLEVFAERLAVRHDSARIFWVLAQRVDRKVCGEQPSLSCGLFFARQDSAIRCDGRSVQTAIWLLVSMFSEEYSAQITRCEPCG